MKRDKRDILYSKLIRFGSGATPICEYCGKEYPNGIGVECSHIYGRRNQTSRCLLNPRNAVSLCHYHHRYFTENPLEFNRFLNALLGEEHLAGIRKVVHSNIKLTRADKEDLYQYLKGCEELLKTLRMNGYQGTVDYPEWKRE